MVSELPMSTTVLSRPQKIVIDVLASDERVVVPGAIEHVGHEQATEKQDFGEQEGPHAEDGRLLLLLQRLELMLQRRMVRGVVAVRVARVRRRQTSFISLSPWRCAA